jgi:hypothetical protein
MTGKSKNNMMIIDTFNNERIIVAKPVAANSQPPTMCVFLHTASDDNVQVVLIPKNRLRGSLGK